MKRIYSTEYRTEKGRQSGSDEIFPRLATSIYAWVASYYCIRDRIDSIDVDTIV